MKKRSKKIQDTVDQFNMILALEVLHSVEVGDGTFENGVSSADPRVLNFKSGVCAVLEYLLHKDNSYRGFMYTGNVSRTFDRKYF